MTNDAIIPELVQIDKSSDERLRLIDQFLSNDSVYNSLDESGKHGVRLGIKRELDKLDNNNMLSDAGIEEAKHWLLSNRVPSFLKNMMDGQIANLRMNQYCTNVNVPSKSPRAPIDFAAQISGPRNR